MDLGTEFLTLLERCVSDITQVLQADRSCAIGDRVAHQLFTRPMEQGHRYGSLMAAHASQETPRAFGANGLDGRTGASDTGTAVVFHPSLEKECSVVCRVSGDHDPLNAEIAADDATFGLWLWNLDFVRKTQIPNLADAFNFGVFPSYFRDRRMLQLDGFPEDSDALLVSQKIAFVGQRDRGALVNTQRPTTLRFLRLVAGCYLSEQGACKLGRNLELLPDNSIESARESVGVQLLGLKHLLGNPASRRKVVKRDCVYVSRLSYLDLDCADCFQYKTT